MICLHDKLELEEFLRSDTFLHLYSLGDLDDFFWPYTTWYGLREGKNLRAVALVYTGVPLPVLLAFAEEDGRPAMNKLLASTLTILPRRFHTHLSPGLEEVFAGHYTLEPHGKHYRMALVRPEALETVDTVRVVSLSRDDLDDLLALYHASYPENWFDTRMLETGQYCGIREGGKLVSAAGVHVYSPAYQVAALGNITTHPDFRNQGLARAVTARLCSSLLETVGAIGLNVSAANIPAIRCYEALGFEIAAPYGEFMATSSILRPA